MWACGRVTSCVMCASGRIATVPRWKVPDLAVVADTHTHTHRKHSSAQSPSGDIGCSSGLVHGAGNPLSNLRLLISTSSSQSVAEENHRFSVTIM